VDASIAVALIENILPMEAEIIPPRGLFPMLGSRTLYWIDILIFGTISPNSAASYKYGNKQEKAKTRINK